MPSLFSTPPCKHVTFYFILIPGVLTVHSNVPWFSSFSYHTGILYLFSHRFLSSLLLVLWFFRDWVCNLFLSLLSIFVFAIFLEIALIFLLALLFQLFFISVSFILFLFHGYNILFQSSIIMPLMFSYLACISCIAFFFLFFFFCIAFVLVLFFLFLLLKTNISYHLWTIRVCYYKIDNTIYVSGLLIYWAKL